MIFGKGDEAFSGLLDFAEKYHVTSAHFTAIGALSGATVAWFDPQRKMYKKIPIVGQVEVISMIGDIALLFGVLAGNAFELYKLGRQTGFGLDKRLQEALIAGGLVPAQTGLLIDNQLRKQGCL